MSEVPLYLQWQTDQSSSRNMQGAGECRRRFAREGSREAERKHGFSAEKVPVSAYRGLSKNLNNLKRDRKNLKGLRPHSRR